MKDLRSKYNIGYDAVMTMAINLETDGKKVTMTGEKLNLGNRWQNIKIDTFLVHLNQFYADTRFHDFYTQHQSFYESVLRTYEHNVMHYFHQDWYPRFYGTEPTERFRIVIGFTNGGGNYGPSRQLTGQPKEVFAICGYSIDEKTGKAFENGMDYAATLIHEFNHSFVNPLYDANADLLLTIGEKLLKRYYPGNGSNQPTETLPLSLTRTISVRLSSSTSCRRIWIKKNKSKIYEPMARDFGWPELVTAPLAPLL